MPFEHKLWDLVGKMCKTLLAAPCSKTDPQMHGRSTCISHWILFSFGWCLTRLKQQQLALGKIMQSTSERKNPRGGASSLSIMFFWWMNDVIKLGNGQPLTEKNLFPLLEDYKAEVLVKTAEKWWLKESRSKTPRLWKAMAGLIPWKSYLIMLALQTLRSLSFVSLPVCLWLLLKTLNDASNSDMKLAFIYVAILGMTSLIQAAST